MPRRSWTGEGRYGNRWRRREEEGEEQPWWLGREGEGEKP